MSIIRTVLRHRRSTVFGTIGLALWFYVFGPTTLWSWFTLVSSLAAVVVFLSIARAYIAPYIVTRFSNHLRVRSISLRSIRGLYFRRGNRTWHVERIGYSYSLSGEGKPIGILLKIQGLRIEIEQLSHEQPARTKHRRRITLVDLSPSPLVLHLWSIMSAVYWVLDPIIRPIIRVSVTSILNQVIHRIPTLTQALRLELESAVIAHTAIPDAQLVIEGATLHAHLTFSHLQVPVPRSDQNNGQGDYRPSAAALAMGAWKSRLAMGFKRTWRRAWDRTLGQTKASLTFDLMINKVIGDTPIHSHLGGEPIVYLPETVNLTGAARFSPRDGKIEAGSVEVTLRVPNVHVSIDRWQSILAIIDNQKTKNAQSPDSPLLTSPLSPQSPMLSSESSSASYNRPHFTLPPARSRKRRSHMSLSFLSKIQVDICSINVTKTVKGDVYRASVQDVSCVCGPSDPDKNSSHHAWLGSLHSPTSSVYFLRLKIRESGLSRLNNVFTSSLQVLLLGALDASFTASEWPSSLQQISLGDPNRPLLLMDLALAEFAVTDRLDVVHRLLSSPPISSPPRASLALPETLSHIPRIIANIDVGRLSARLVCVDVKGSHTPFTLVLESKGLNAHCTSTFRTKPSITFNSSHPYSDQTGLHMILQWDFHMEPVFLNLNTASISRRTSRRFSTQNPNSEGFDSLLSLEAIEAKGTLAAVGEFIDDGQTAFNLLRTKSLFLDLHCYTEGIILELWHPQYVAAVIAVIPLLLTKESTSAPSDKPLTLPLGFTVSLSVARLVLFVTGQDINPNAENDVTCGVAFNTGIAMRYCSMHPEQANSVEHGRTRTRTQNRHKLHLPTDYLADALVSARASTTSTESTAYGKMVLWNTFLRSAAADTYSMDDPYIFEKDDPAFAGKNFVYIHRTEVDVTSRGTRSQSLGTLQCSTNTISAAIDEVRISFDLGHVTASLLALQVLRNIMPNPQPAKASGGSHVLGLSFRGMVKALQIQWNLPGQQPVTRINYLEATVSPENVECCFNSLVFWVPMPAKPHRWREAEEDRWEELGRLHRWTITCGGNPSDAILIEGDSVRFAVPSGYILADLLLDITMSIKASRHIHRMVTTGTYFPFPPPEAEGPKVVPNISVSIRAICLEAADDPFESQLGLLCRTGLDAAKERIQREDAFDAKVSAILAAEGADAPPSHNTAFSSDYQFDAGHSISVHEARERLHMVHSLDWLLRHRQRRQKRADKEDNFHRNFRGPNPLKRPTNVPNLVNVSSSRRTPPLFRAVIYGFQLQLSQPSFPPERLPDFLHVQGRGVPKDTSYTLLVPVHLDVSLTSLRVTLRDYPLPLLHIPFHSEGKDLPVLKFISDLVIAEDMGSSQSVEWIPCMIGGAHGGFVPGSPLVIEVPKTIMPVKTYANPTVQVMTDGITAFGWGVSYSATTQDIVRVLESLTSETRDPSPSIGFWDKLRLIFHWTIEVSFTNEARLYMKGTRDPYTLHDEGAGFALCWKGNPKLLVGFPNDVNELIQVSSDTMSIIIPKFDCESDTAQNKPDASEAHNTAPGCVKTCAKLGSGVRFGVGVILERSCSSEDCTSCAGSSFDRHCRFFTFRPHHDVQLATTKTDILHPQRLHDSYRGFRSDFIHLSVSLTSSLHSHTCADPSSPSSFHLTPHAFAHFWSWWALFDSNLSLPVRQGSYYPSKAGSPKFSRHLATVKYRLSAPRLFISHVYIDDTRDSWVSGTTSFVGTKANVGHFQADMHQRDQESIAPGDSQDSIKVVRHKPFYAAEVVMKDIDLRAMLATFSEPLKQAIPLSFEGDRDANNSTRPLPTSVPSDWIDADDFVETDWSSKHEPDIQLLPLLLCSRLTYFKKNVTSGPMEGSKFGVEDTHTCLLGSEASVPQIEVDLANERIAQLGVLAAQSAHANEGTSNSLHRMMALLQDYANHLRMTENPHTASRSSNIENYYMPSETVEADEWAEFENVYQVHAPKVFMNDSIRDIMLQYYNCSKSRQGFEYHMATRAVKFIRDQADAALSTGPPTNPEKSKGPVNTTQTAATVLKRILNRDRNGVSIEVADDVADEDGVVNPLVGWDEGVALQKRHFCLLLKPQIVLRSEGSPDSVSVLAAVQAKLQAFTIMDKSNLEDPISGTIMTRSYMSLDGLQTFCPVDLASCGDGCVPLEVLIDYRCESDAFDRIVPQTNATCQYDRFNRLRLRNNVTSVTRSVPDNEHRRGKYAHLQNETDLVQVRVPRFTVSASDRHFQSISNIITNLILFSDAAHKTRLDRLEALLFAYDFTDFTSAANVVSDLQSRLRNALETRRDAENHALSAASGTKLEILKLGAHIFLLTEELNLIFDAIKLAQDRADERSDQKSALLLLASSSEISWQMLDEHQELLAKLVVRDIDFSWLSKQDSATATNLVMGDLQAFDGSPQAPWPEIVSKFEDPSNHPMSKRGVFLDADWAVLAPVGGISIYEKFQLDFHPIRLQLDASLGQRIMEYVWPARRSRNRGTDTAPPFDTHHPKPRASLDSSTLLNQPRSSLDSTSLTPPLRKLGPSRSFTDLRSAAADSMITPYPATQSNQRSFTASPDTLDESRRHRHAIMRQGSLDHKTDFDEMKTRSSQKNFVLVKISSLELLLSIMKASSFECRDARIRTHALEIRNQTWSFEELVDQFIPSDLTWKGWVKIALHQPLVPVFPVARELFSKTKLTASKSVSQLDPRPPRKILKLKPKRTDTNSTVVPARQRRSSSSGTNPRFIGMSLTDEPTVMDESTPSPTVPDNNRPSSRARLLSVFSRSRKSLENTLDSGHQSVDNCDPDSAVTKEGF
ncbi:golgi-body localization protein domain-containing protein [Suillus clintonianus]|uniref:golgi-body localization protein domain-containing protein n=1 Tax=Suillus clintonianus TaxID=1904413 RepID=UPI001B8795C0|nr:golgi-body localization protein domain-containing protein [Suillus clintonianus]KAG2156152.1 golgi-body localization protein domain-containing protein [Suillus clintonianus]